MNSIRDNVKDAIVKHFKYNPDRFGKLNPEFINEDSGEMADILFDVLGINEFEQDYNADESSIRVFNKDKICNSWCIEDVIGRALEREIELTKEQAQDVLTVMSHRYDAEYGINWTVIDCFIDEVIIEEDSE